MIKIDYSKPVFVKQGTDKRITSYLTSALLNYGFDHSQLKFCKSWSEIRPVFQIGDYFVHPFINEKEKLRFFISVGAWGQVVGRITTTIKDELTIETIT